MQINPASVWALMCVAVCATPAVASETCHIKVDGQAVLDGQCRVSAGRLGIFFDQGDGGRVLVVVRDEATPDRGETYRSDQAGWRERLGVVRHEGSCLLRQDGKE